MCPLNYPHGVTSWAGSWVVLGWSCEVMGWLVGGSGLACGWSDGLEWRGYELELGWLKLCRLPVMLMAVILANLVINNKKNAIYDTFLFMNACIYQKKVVPL